MINKLIKFAGVDCDLDYTRYYDGNKCLVLVDSEGFTVAKATTNIDTHLEHNQVCIKSYFENKGMLKALFDAGVIERVVEVIPYNHVDIHKVQLTKEVLEEFEPDSTVRETRVIRSVTR